MRNIFVLISKELRIYFISPIAYTVMSVFLLVIGFLFFNIVSFYNLQSLQYMQLQGNMPKINLHEALFAPTFHNMSVILLLLVPLITMRLFAEEKKNKTMELLLTSPISIVELILGKYLSSVALFLILLILTLPMPILISLFKGVEWGTIISSYLGLLLLGSLFISIGIFSSALTENQIVAAIIGFGILLMLWLVGFVKVVTGDSLYGDILSYLSINEHFDNFVKGLIDTTDIIYFISGISLWIFLTSRVVESQRWK